MYDPAQMKKIKTLKELAPEGMAAWAALITTCCAAPAA